VTEFPHVILSVEEGGMLELNQPDRRNALGCYSITK
jgi:hypothetical protein